MTHDSLAHIALHPAPQDVVADAVGTARRLAGADAAFAAVARGGGVYEVTALDMLSDPRWEQMRCWAGRGLGGKALAESRPCVTADYIEDSSISGDFRVVVRAEGLHRMSCVPVGGPTGIAALLYLSERRVGPPADRQVELLMHVADLVEVGLTLAARRAAALSGSAASQLLSSREREVLKLLCEGASNRRIGTELAIAESTVKGHVRGLIDKFGASSRLDVVARASAATRR